MASQKTSSTNPSAGSGRASSMADLMSRQTSSFQTLQKGQEIEGTVKKLTPKEILLDIGAKGDALVIEYDHANLEQLLSMLKVGDRVKAVVISPEAEEGFPVVSLRRALGQKTFGDLESIHKDGTIVDVIVSDQTRGGYFASLKNGVKGFLPNSQVITEENIAGTTIQAKIIELDRVKKRVIFSQKAVSYLTDLEALKTLFPKGEKVKGFVSQILPYGLFIEIKNDKNTIEGFIHISEISHDRVEDIGTLYKKGDSVEAIVLDVDPENKRVSLSVKQLAADTFGEVEKTFTKDKEVKGKVTDVKGRGVNVELEGGVKGFIPSDKVPAGTEYTKGETITATVADIDKRKRVVVLSPVVTKIFVGYR